MRRFLVVALSVSALLAGGTVSATASSAEAGSAPSAASHDGWVPEAIPPTYDAPAGLLCDFPVHWDVTVNQVRTKVVESYPDGKPKRQLATGALFLNVSNAATGASTLVDASGSAVIEYGSDGSMVWHVVGPVIARIPAGFSNLPRGLYTIDGVYRIAFSATGFKTVTLVHGTTHNLCDDLG